METLLNMNIEGLKNRDAYTTAKEINQQPRLWKETTEILEKKWKEIESFIKPRIQIPGMRIIFTGAGTSAYVGDTAASYLANKLNLRIESIATTDIVSSPEHYFKAEIPTILVSFARSGNSPESLGAYNLAGEIIRDLSHIVITCNEEGGLAKECEKNDQSLLLLMPKESDDKGFAMTGAFTCMLLSSLLIFDLDNFEENVLKVGTVTRRGDAILKTKTPEILELVELGYERVIYLGSASLAGLSQEAALKSLELTSGKIFSLSESTLGFRHGPKSIINDKTLVFLFVSGDEYTRQYDIDLINELTNDEGTQKIVPIVQESKWNQNTKAFKVLSAGDDGMVVDDVYSALDYILFAQLFAFFNSLSLGITPDNPRPDGSLNRVVQGVTIYDYLRN